jgi:hypothetical protein
MIRNAMESDRVNLAILDGYHRDGLGIMVFREYPIV